MIKFERAILKDLYESVNGLLSYTLYSKYKVEPDKIFFFIEKYKENGTLTYEDNRLVLTKEGKSIILKQFFQIKHGLGKFSNIPNEFIVAKIEINSPYLPNIENVSIEILNK